RARQRVAVALGDLGARRDPRRVALGRRADAGRAGVRRLWAGRRRPYRVLRVLRTSVLTDRERLAMATSKSTNERGIDLEALDLAHMFHPNTNLAALHAGRPLVLVRGEGVHVWDNHGKRY